MPGPLQNTSFDQNLGAQLPLDALLIDESGQAVRLGSFFESGRPVILAFVYYECPMLCGLVMHGLSKALSVLSFDVGKQFDVVAISIDPGETPAMAEEAEALALQRYQRPETEPNWHFLTATEPVIERIAGVAGFNYAYDPKTDEYAHPSGVIVVTPDGVLSQYFYGIEYAPKDLRLALVEASNSGIGSVIDQIMLYCFQYDPQLAKYTAVTMRIVRLAGVVFVAVLLTFLWIMMRYERSRSAQTPNLGAA
ncbi:MAG: SCO family protein [Acidobacteriota bacterium]